MAEYEKPDLKKNGRRKVTVPRIEAGVVCGRVGVLQVSKNPAAVTEASRAANSRAFSKSDFQFMA